MQLTSRSGRLITLRPPHAGDETLLFNYAKTLEAENTFVLLNPDHPVTYQEETDYLKGILKRIESRWQVMFLAFAGDTLIGSCQVVVQGRRKMHLGNFGISLLKEYRQDGIGRQLAELAITEASHKLQVKLITLEVFANNAVALKLYQDLGFRPYGRLPNGLKYKDQFVDAILMYKPVSE